MVRYLKRLKSSRLGRVLAFPMYGGLGMSAPSLHRESTDSLIYIVIIVCHKHTNSHIPCLLDVSGSMAFSGTSSMKFATINEVRVKHKKAYLCQLSTFYKYLPWWDHYPEYGVTCRKLSLSSPFYPPVSAVAPEHVPLVPQAGYLLPSAKLAYQSGPSRIVKSPDLLGQ